MALSYCGVVYDSDPGDVDRLGWEEFVLRQWELIFTGYRSWVGVRQIGRRWADLIEGGLGCSQDLTDWLVREEIVYGQDRQLGASDSVTVLAGMAEVLNAVRDDLAALGRSGILSPGTVASMLDRHALLAAAVGVVDEPLPSDYSGGGPTPLPW
jgi:hypothetical protein